MLHAWFLKNCCLLCNQPSKTHHDGRFYQLHIHCSEEYPAVPPLVKFVSKINMNCVDSKTGAVKKEKLPAMRNWNRNMGIEQILQSIRMEMCSDQNRRLRQPAEGLTFWAHSYHPFLSKTECFSQRSFWHFDEKPEGCSPNKQLLQLISAILAQSNL